MGDWYVCPMASALPPLQLGRQQQSSGSLGNPFRGAPNALRQRPTKHKEERKHNCGNRRHTTSKSCTCRVNELGIALDVKCKCSTALRTACSVPKARWRQNADPDDACARLPLTVLSRVSLSLSLFHVYHRMLPECVLLRDVGPPARRARSSTNSMCPSADAGLRSAVPCAPFLVVRMNVRARARVACRLQFRLLPPRCPSFL
jgi:hypothetical protein